jgi:hypothetical protein
MFIDISATIGVRMLGAVNMNVSIAIDVSAAIERGIVFSGLRCTHALEAAKFRRSFLELRRASIDRDHGAAERAGYCVRRISLYSHAGTGALWVGR